MRPTAGLTRFCLCALLTTTLSCGDGGKKKDASIDGVDAPSSTRQDATDPQTDLATNVVDVPARKDDASTDGKASDGADIVDSPLASWDEAPQTCWYEKAREGTPLSQFSFSFVAPDQVSYACSHDPARDAGPPWPRQLRGAVTSVTDSQFTIDTCLAQDACTPSLYTFTLSASGLRLTIPVGRQVRVQWDISEFWGCVQWLAVTDDEPDLAGRVWLVGNSGLQRAGSELPFDIGLDQLDCRLPADAYRTSCSGAATGDYAFRFSSNYGPPSSLVLGTQESGIFTFQNSIGAEQKMDIHCLKAFQTTWCDDYWNWDFWAVDVSPPPDGPAHDAAIDL